MEKSKGRATGSCAAPPRRALIEVDERSYAAAVGVLLDFGFAYAPATLLEAPRGALTRAAGLYLVEASNSNALAPFARRVRNRFGRQPILAAICSRRRGSLALEVGEAGFDILLPAPLSPPLFRGALSAVLRGAPELIGTPEFDDVGDQDHQYKSDDKIKSDH